MKDYRTRVSFEKAFKKAVTNFDETKIWFEHKSKSYEPSKICFVYEGKLRKLPMYKSEHYINLWKNYFIEFLNTGDFDMNGHYEIYTSDGATFPPVSFPFNKFQDNEFYCNSKEFYDYLKEQRDKFGDCGIRQVPKP